MIDPISLVLGAGGALAAYKGLQSTREHRSEPAGIADLLLWGFMVDDGTVLQKDGSFLAGWQYRGPDLNAATPEELDQLSRHINAALLPFADNWMFHVDAVRKPSTRYAPQGAFRDPVTRLIDTERRTAHERRGEHFETEYFLMATHLPPPELYSRAGALFVQGETRSVDWGRVLGEFRGALHDLENRLSSRLKMQRLDSGAVATHLHACLTGLHHPVRVPSHGSYLNYVLADQELLGGFKPQIGRLAIRPVAVQGYPHESHSGILDPLNTLGFAYRWSNRIIPLGRHTAAKLIRRQQLEWFQKRKGAGSWARELAQDGTAVKRPADEEMFLDEDARNMARDAANAAAENASGAVRFCFYNSTILVKDADPDRADYIAGEIIKVLNDAGFTARVEGLNALEAYLSTLPGHGQPNIRRPILSSANIADLLPITSIWPGLDANPSPLFPPNSPPLLWSATGGSTPFRVNLHDSDVGHTLVIGKTGAGKSTLVGLITAQFQRYPNAQVFVFDVGYSAWLLAKAAGGEHYDIAAGKTDQLRFQPLAHINRPAERVWAAEWLEMLFSLQGVQLTPPLRQSLDRALALVAQNPEEHRTLTELAVQLQNQELTAALRPYTVGGNFGFLLDSNNDAIADGSYQVFELKHLMDLDNKILLPVLLYLFRRVEQKLDAGRPSLIIIEEAWLPLMHSVFASRIKQWLLTLRKENAAVMLVTQSLSQLYDSANRHIIIESCPTRILLPNAEAATPGSRQLYVDLGLNDTEISMIASAQPKRHYYFTSPRGNRLFELGLGPVALSFLSPREGMTMQETARQAEAVIAEHGAAWPGVWLRQRGLSNQAEIFHRYPGEHHEGGTHVDTAVERPAWRADRGIPAFAGTSAVRGP
ncbi:conjugal transfer protein TrbE [soil metagenome]|jgi:type IV secretion system protein VirB4